MPASQLVRRGISRAAFFAEIGKCQREYADTMHSPCTTRRMIKLVKSGATERSVVGIDRTAGRSGPDRCEILSAPPEKCPGGPNLTTRQAV
jgi:hypothetical protein